MEKLCVAIEFELKCQASQAVEEAAAVDLVTAVVEVVAMAIETVAVVLAAVVVVEEDLASTAVKVDTLLANAHLVEAAEVVIAEMAEATVEIVEEIAVVMITAEEMAQEMAVMDTRVEVLEGEIVTEAVLQEDSVASQSLFDTPQLKTAQRLVVVYTSL